MSAPRQRLVVLYAVIMLVVPLVGFPFVHPFAMVASAETLQGGNASTVHAPWALNAPASAIIEPSTDSDIVVSYDTGMGGTTHTITMMDQDGNPIDSATSTSASDSLTLTIAGNTITSGTEAIVTLDVGGMNWGQDFVDIGVRDLSNPPTVDLPNVTISASGDTTLDVGYNAEGAISGSDTLKLELWDPNEGTKLDTVSGLEAGDLRGVAQPQWPASDYANGGQVELRLIRNAGNQLATDTATITEGAVITASSIEHAGGTNPSVNDIAIDDDSFTFGQQSIVFFNLHKAGNTQQRDISTVGADETTELWVNFTVENYTPDVMMGAAEVEQWSSEPAQNAEGTNLSILLRPTDAQRYYDWNNPVPFDPTKWPDRAEVATHGVDAGVELTVADLGDSGPMGDLKGAQLTTDAQVFTPPMVVDGQLQFNVAAPHCTVDTSGGSCDDEPANVNDDGFYEAVVPAAFIDTAWGDIEPSDLTGTYNSDGSEEELTLAVTELDNGDLKVRADDIHYSNGTIALEPAEEGSSGGGSSSGSSSTPTPTPTATPTPEPTATPTSTPEPTETSTQTSTATPEPITDTPVPTGDPTDAPTRTEETGPGFGALGALAAIVVGLALLARRR